MLIVKPTMPGVEIESKEPSVLTNFAHMPVMPILEPVVATLAEVLLLTVTMMELVSDVLEPLVLMMVLLVPVETLSVMPVVSV